MAQNSSRQAPPKHATQYTRSPTFARSGGTNWPVGWINSGSHDAASASKYPWHFGQFSHYITGPDSPIRNAKTEFPKPWPTDLNRWRERHTF
jgi:hypothetical protein